MSLIKLMPLAALGAAGAVGVTVMKDNADVIGKFQVAATRQVELAGIADAVAMDYTDTQRLPVDNFPDWLRENMRENKGGNTRDKALDQWGTPFFLAPVKTGFEVCSAGPDLKWRTGDDLRHYYDLAGISPNPPRGPEKAVLPVGAQMSADADDPDASQPDQAGRQTARTNNKRRPQRPPPDEIEQNVIEFQMKQALRGSSRSQYDLGMRYLNGEGLNQNQELAVEWLRKSAEGGFKDAEVKLQMLEAGLE